MVRFNVFTWLTLLGAGSGTVYVLNLFDDSAQLRYHYHCPILSVALHPHYQRARQFVYGTKEGRLVHVTRTSLCAYVRKRVWVNGLTCRRFGNVQLYQNARSCCR